jgi:hypothetical protein
VENQKQVSHFPTPPILFLSKPKTTTALPASQRVGKNSCRQTEKILDAEQNAGVRRNNSGARTCSPSAFTANLRLLLGTGIGAAPMGITSFFVYLPTFAVQELRLPLHAAFYTLMLSPCLAVVANLTLADLPDKVGRIQIMLPACVLSLISIYSVCALLVHHKSVPVLLLAVGSRCTKRHPC